jgi:hypothetical protein
MEKSSWVVQGRLDVGLVHDKSLVSRNFGNRGVCFMKKICGASGCSLVVSAIVLADKGLSGHGGVVEKGSK